MDESHNFPLGIFPLRIQSIIKELNRDRKYPIDYLSGAILWVASVLIGACSYLKTTLGKTYANIYMMLVGAQGAGKSHPLSWATAYLHELDNAALTIYEREMEEYEAARARGEQPEKPSCRRLLIDGSTPEAAFKRLEENPKGIGQCADEIRKAFGDLGRYANSSDVEVYLRLFNGDTLTIDRAHQNTLHVSRPYFCLCGTIQNPTFNRLFTKDKVENGLLARFVEIVHYEEGALLWNLTEDLPSGSEIEYQNFLVKMLERRDAADIRHPHEYRLTSEAAETIQSWQNGHEVKIESHGRDIDRATFRKIQIYVLKFALIIQIMADVDSGRENPEHLVDFGSATLATLLADYFFMNAKDLARSVYVRKLSQREQEAYEALPVEFESDEGLAIAKKHGLGKTCYYDLLSKLRGVLIDQPFRGHYVKRFTQ